MPEHSSTTESDTVCGRTPWFLYLIECVDGSIYTGITVDVIARYQAHACGRGARYTRSHPPLRLLAVVEHPDQSAASKAEYQIKQLTAGKKRAYAKAVSSPISPKSLASITMRPPRSIESHSMSKTKALTMACDMDDEVADPKSQRRPLHKGETVPHIPTMYEQMDMAWAAANSPKPKSR